jgi:hypothetical protein
MENQGIVLIEDTLRNIHLLFHLANVYQGLGVLFIFTFSCARSCAENWRYKSDPIMTIKETMILAETCHLYLSVIIKHPGRKYTQAKKVSLKYVNISCFKGRNFMYALTINQIFTGQFPLLHNCS